jgi:hypothetical protein
MNTFSAFVKPTVLEQTMKKKMLLAAVLMMVWVFPCEGIALQKADIIDPVFTFDPVPEGVHIDHVFIVKNTGDTLLRIEKVMPP